MPRLHREKSSIHTYHCMLRGINKQDIFFDTQDYLKFIKEIKRTKETFHYQLYAYVLMPNHVHLEIKDEIENLSKIMLSIQIRYATYFNRKYEREGHLFQNRFKSKPVETQSYLLNLIRYIHQNPQKALIAKTEHYKWSSYQEYFKCKSIVNSEDIFNLFNGKTQEEKRQKFIKFNQKFIQFKNSELFLNFEIRNRLTDEELIDFIKETLKIHNVQEIQRYNKENRDKLLLQLKDIKGASKSQLSRVLGINMKLIQRVFSDN